MAKAVEHDAVWMLITRQGEVKDLVLFRDFDLVRTEAEKLAADDQTARDAIRAFSGHVLDVQTRTGMRIALIFAPVL